VPGRLRRGRSTTLEVIRLHLALEECFHHLAGRKAVGIDGVSKAEYGEHLDLNLKDLVARMRRMAYRPTPVRRVRIPKEGQPQQTRPLGERDRVAESVQGEVPQPYQSAGPSPLHTILPQQIAPMVPCRYRGMTLGLWTALSVILRF
jgi:hypothetical protein